MAGRSWHAAQRRTQAATGSATSSGNSARTPSATPLVVNTADRCGHTRGDGVAVVPLPALAP